jgi:cation diffusion facilitator CzcD-associated flavoprotein CzcO
MRRSAVSDRQNQSEFDVVIVGAGFAGLFMLHRVRGQGLTARVFEAGSGVGGTWFWNRYPGARCDVESVEYSYQFSDELQQEWEWTERYAGQPEILEYLNHVADRFDLRKDICFETRVESAAFDDERARWTVRTSAGDEVSGQFLVMATGCLSSANVPDFKGSGSFGGETYHTGRWPEEGVEFAGKRVGVIGTGSSAIQSIPIIAAEAESLVVFQRTPAYSVPARNGPLDGAEVQEIKSDYSGFRARNNLMVTAFGSRTPHNDISALAVDEDERLREFESRWERGGFGYMAAYNDLLLNPDANEVAADFVRRKIRETVRDPEVAEKLLPNTVIGCKRLCLDTGFYETFNRENVDLVDVSETPVEITPKGIRVGAEEYALDCIVFATGFDAMTGALLAIDIRGRDGVSLRDAWADGPRTYLGLGIVGFPNLFSISGPGSPSVLTNMVVSIEQHVNFIADCIDYMREHGLRQIEAAPDAQDAWVEFVNVVADFTLYPRCNSWYLGANVPGKPRVFMPLIGFPTYVEKCEQVVADGYEGFVLT